jgi:hypothetical protein
MGKFAPHTILQGDARKEVWVWGGEEEDAEEPKPGIRRSSEHRRRRVTFILVYFLYREKESNLHP